jgi:lysophospholipase L1-like esterase
VRAQLLKDDLLALAAYGESLAANEHVSVIDATTTLSFEDFRDDLHLSVSGARRLTSMIAKTLAATR